MSCPTPSPLSWEDTFLDRILEMTRAADGDFAVIGRLFQAANDDASVQATIAHLSRQPQGLQAFAERPQIGAVNLEELLQLPENTLGHAYAYHLRKNGLHPLATQPAESDAQYLALHITETHDIWHVVTGCSTHILGELQLEAFYIAQLQTSRFWLALLIKNLLKTVVYEIDQVNDYMEAITTGWLMGKQAKPLFGIAWATLWQQPLDDIRATLNLHLTD